MEYIHIFTNYAVIKYSIMQRQTERLLSIDTLRGFDMLFIMGLSGLVVNICNLFPSGADCWLAGQMNHSDWNGITHHGMTLFFRVAGLNSITIYMAQKIVGFSAINRFFLGGLAGMLPPEWEAVVLSAGYIAACWLFLYFLYRKHVFLKV